MSESDKYVVTVYASSSSAIDATFKAEARKLGEGLAKADYALCVGGGKYGLMGAVTDGCLASGGVADCVILKMFVGANMHPGPFRTTEVYDTMTARKDGLYRRADAFIALPGGLGTLEELSEVMSWRQLEIHSKPIVLINTNGFYTEFWKVRGGGPSPGSASHVEAFDRYHPQRPAATNKCIFMVDEVAEAMTILKEYKPVTIHKQGDLEAADWTLRSSDNISNEIEKK